MKRISVIIIALFISSATFAQFHLGIKGGVSMSKLTTNISDVVEAAKTGYQLGAFVRIGDKFHLQPEIYFSAKPGQVEFTLPDINDPDKKFNITEDINFSTVDIPVLVGFRLLKIPLGNIRLQAGPVASFVTNSTMTISKDGVELPEDDYPKDFKNFNWAAQFGAGVDVLFLTIDLRYELGITNLYDKPENASDDWTYKNNVFFLSVGWKIF
jgi:hypothetical protein